MGLKVCNRCLMDSSDPEIKFDDKGFCNHCIKHFFELPNRVWFGAESKTIRSFNPKYKRKKK